MDSLKLVHEFVYSEVQKLYESTVLLHHQGFEKVLKCERAKIIFYLLKDVLVTQGKTKPRILQDCCKQESHLRVLLSTVAFGMGVNVYDLRRVYIYKLPKSTAILWQEIRRVGRKGEKSDCKIFVPQNPAEKGLASSLKN